MLTVDTAESILTLYNNKLPFPVAEYFCYAFRDKIICKKTLNYKLFKEFLNYKDNITYVFGAPIGVSTNDYQFIELRGIEISIPIGKDEEFMENYSNWIFTSSDDVGLTWFDDNELDDKFDMEKYSGRCKITF